MRAFHNVKVIIYKTIYKIIKICQIKNLNLIMKMNLLNVLIINFSKIRKKKYILMIFIIRPKMAKIRVNQNLVFFEIEF